MIVRADSPKPTKRAPAPGSAGAAACRGWSFGALVVGVWLTVAGPVHAGLFAGEYRPEHRHGARHDHGSGYEPGAELEEEPVQRHDERSPREPARVWVDGHDIDGPPRTPPRLPVYFGASVWATGVTSKIRAKRVSPSKVRTWLWGRKA